MSSIVVSKVVEMDLDYRPKAVLLALADQANDEGIAWPSSGSLERRTGFTPKTISSALGSAEYRGIIAIAKQSTTGNVYRFTGVAKIATPVREKQQRAEEGSMYAVVIDAFNTHMVKLTKAIKLTDKRKRLIAKAWKDHPSAEFFDGYFSLCAEDSFLNGTGPYTNGHAGWLPNFEYLTREDTITRVVEKAHAMRARGEA